MTNLNKLRLTGNATLVAAGTTIASGVLDQAVNDLKRPLKIVAIQIASLMEASTLVANQKVQLRLAIGTQNGFDNNTNLFEWIQWYEVAGTPANAPANTQPLNQVIGNFKDVLFELEVFDAELAGGNSAKGQLFLLQTVNNVGSVVGTVTLKCQVVLYYK